MIKQRRWLCKECKREWIEPTACYVNSSPLTITGNKRNDLCPICGSGSIEYVEYTPPFPGGDIPREGEEVVQLPESEFPPTQRPMSNGFIQNNLIAMMIEDQK